MEPSFKVFFAKKSTYRSHEQYTESTTNAENCSSQRHPNVHSKRALKGSVNDEVQLPHRFSLLLLYKTHTLPIGRYVHKILIGYTLKESKDFQQ